MEYISRDTALKALNEGRQHRTWSMDDVDTMDQMEDYLEKVPVEDVVPREEVERLIAKASHDTVNSIFSSFRNLMHKDLERYGLLIIDESIFTDLEKGYKSENKFEEEGHLFTPSEVSRMSSEEVKQNYNQIIKSMKSWN